MQCTRNHHHALTLIELLTVMAMVVVLTGLLLSGMSLARVETRAAIYLSNLRQIGAAIYMYTVDHDGRMPSNKLDGVWDILMGPCGSNSQVTWCPSDQAGAGVAAVSYVWRDALAVADATASLSGRNL